MSDQKHGEQRLILQTQKWIETVIIGHNYCPFAKREVENNKVRYQVIQAQGLNECLDAITNECIYLDENADTETTLLIFPLGLEEFETFLDFLTLAEDKLSELGYEGIYQLASFHPKYCFQGADDNDSANYTNRSPYPMLHLIREASIEKALQHYPAPEGIPERNIEFARSQGLEKMQSLLKNSMNLDTK
jgi:hypothetical protein